MARRTHANSPTFAASPAAAGNGRPGACATRGSGNSGDPASSTSLIAANYDDLRALARALLGHEQHSLTPTGIVHEAFLRVAQVGGGSAVSGAAAGAPAAGGPRFATRAEFMAYAAGAIRSVLVDHARRRCALRRGGGAAPEAFEERLAPRELTDEGLLELDRALDRLGVLCERQRQVVELRFFGQLSVEQTAAALGVSPRTVKSDWRCARAWLYRELRR